LEIDLSITALFAAIRAVHFGACLLLFGVWVFDRLIAGPLNDSPDFSKHWLLITRLLISISLPLVVLSGAAWLGVNAINMSGLPPGLALRGDILRIVLTDTHFGRLWEIRAMLFGAALIIWIPALIVASSSRLRPGLVWTSLLLSGAVAGSLAWAGHGLTGEPMRWHLLADVIHILIAGFWPVGLLPLALILWKLGRTKNGIPIARIVRRFSVTSLTSVALLMITGLVNSWVLVGSVSDLVSTTYGRVLIAKVVLFFAIIGLGAVNLIHLKPRLSVDLSEGTSQPGLAATRRLQLNVMIELALSVAIFLLVGLLGLLPPAMEAMLHQHHHHG
jgi:putative copper resistance protein D